MKKRLIKALPAIGALLVVGLFATGYYAAAVDAGSQSDPLVTLSYINGVLKPDILSELGKTLDTRTVAVQKSMSDDAARYGASLDAKVLGYEANYLASKMSDELLKTVISGVAARVNNVPAAESYAVVTVEKGKKMICGVGCEIVLRIGSATCYASSSPGLINLSTGSDLASGKALSQNSLYLVTIAGRGFTATQKATVLVRGSYSIS